MKKISIYILLIISIFILNGQHVYAACSTSTGAKTPTAGVNCAKMDKLGEAYNASGILVSYYLQNEYTELACESPRSIAKRKIKDYRDEFFNYVHFTQVYNDGGQCNFRFSHIANNSKYYNIVPNNPNYNTMDYAISRFNISSGVEMWGSAKKKSDFHKGCFYDSKKNKYMYGTYGEGNYLKYHADIKELDCKSAKICELCEDGKYNWVSGGVLNLGEGCKKVDSSSCSSNSSGNQEEVPTRYGDAGSSCGITFMQLGCKGDYVKDFQNKLNAVQNCGLDVDGSFGNKTAQCVMSFQKDNGLESDGVAGSKTIDKLNSKYTELQTKNDEANLEYHKLIFNTNGGTFANGETTRTVWYLKDEKTLSPATIPGKKGYKFLGWYNGNEKYTFGNKLTSDVTLTAKYEKSTTTKFCEDGDVLDIDNNQCITVQDFADQDKNKFYIINNRLLTIQTKFIYTRNCSSDNKYTVTYEKAEGSNNSISCDTENGYVRDTWRAEDTCQNDKTCPIKDGNNSCQRVYRGTCYASYDPGDTALGTKPDSDNTYNKDINNNATESPQTGGGIIALIIVTLSIIGLSIFCYKVYNNKKEEV